MKVKVYVDRLNIKKSLSAKSIKELIEKLKINENEYIIVKNNELVTVDAKIKDGDEIKFLTVISGG
jgi:sulfur carrier protein ThiS